MPKNEPPPGYDSKNPAPKGNVHMDVTTNFQNFHTALCTPFLVHISVAKFNHLAIATAPIAKTPFEREMCPQRKITYLIQPCYLLCRLQSRFGRDNTPVCVSEPVVSANLVPPFSPSHLKCIITIRMPTHPQPELPPLLVVFLCVLLHAETVFLL